MLTFRKFYVILLLLLLTSPIHGQEQQYPKRWTEIKNNIKCSCKVVSKEPLKIQIEITYIGEDSCKISWDSDFGFLLWSHEFVLVNMITGKDTWLMHNMTGGLFYPRNTIELQKGMTLKALLDFSSYLASLAKSILQPDTEGDIRLALYVGEKEKKSISNKLCDIVISSEKEESSVRGKLADFTDSIFWIYKDKSERNLHHYIPCGWMGDYGDLIFKDSYRVKDSSGTCIQIKYSAKGSQKAGWAGIYWYNSTCCFPRRGLNLGSAQCLKFLARGEKGGEIIREFKVGGVQGEILDTCEASIGPITLAKEWKEYQIDLKGKDLSYLEGGFAWVAEKKDNPDGMIFYLDDIRFEKTGN